MIPFEKRIAWSEVNTNIEQLNDEHYGIVISRALLSQLNCYLCPVQKDGKIGFMNSNGQIVIEPQYSAVSSSFESKDSFVQVRDEAGKDGIINSLGSYVISIGEYREVYLHGNFAVLRDNGNKWGVINLKTSEVIVDFGKYKWVDYKEGFHCGLIRVIMDGSPEMEALFEMYKTDLYLEANEKFAKLKIPSESWGLVDKEGKEVLPCKYPRLINVKENSAQCEFDFTYIDAEGKDKSGYIFGKDIFYE